MGFKGAKIHRDSKSSHLVVKMSATTVNRRDVCDAFGPVSTAYNFCGVNNSATFVVPTVTSSGATGKRLLVDNVPGGKATSPLISVCSAAAGVVRL
jgi:hypothetical protein